MTDVMEMIPAHVDDRDVSSLEEDDDDEEGDLEFNCEPVKKTFVHIDEERQQDAGPKRFSAGLLRDAAINFNSTRQATLHADVKGLATGYVDQDTSGNYDPATERRKIRSVPPRIRRNTQQTVEEKRHRHRFGHGLLVVLPLSGKVLEYAKTLPLGPFSMLSDVSDIDSSDTLSHGGPRTRKKRRITINGTARNEGKTIDELALGNPLRRGCKECFEIGDAGCSMINDQQDYPCDACDEQGILCEPITIPELKRPCGNCRQKRLKCSYRENGGRGATSCDNCTGYGTSCIAGPLQEILEHRYAGGKLYIPKIKEKTTENVSQMTDERSSIVKIKQDPALLNEVLPFLKARPRPIRDPASRVWVMCNQCRVLGLNCRLSRSECGPCRPCKMVGESCEFVYPIVPRTSMFSNSTDQDAHPQHHTQNLLSERLNRKSFTTKKGEQKRLEKGAKDAAKVAAKGVVKAVLRGPLYPGPGETLGIKHKYIKTAFSHPIRFNYQPDPDNVHPCSWCFSPVFGLFGHGMKEVEVVPFDIGYEEISGGHGQDNRDPSKMCVICTFQRLKMIACHSHLMRPLQHIASDTLNMRKLEMSFRALMQYDEDGGQLARQTIWCSICITPAEYSCCVGPTGTGCGLHLCQGCNELLIRLVNGTSTGLDKIRILDVLINLWKEDQWKMDEESEKGDLRADAEFLLSTGELFLRTSKGMQISTHDKDPFREQYRALKRDGKGALRNVKPLGSVFSRPSTGAGTSVPSLPVLQKSLTGINDSLPKRPARPAIPHVSSSISNPTLMEAPMPPAHTAIIARALAAGKKATAGESSSSDSTSRSTLIPTSISSSRIVPPSQSSATATSRPQAGHNSRQAVSAQTSLSSTSLSRLLQSATLLQQPLSKPLISQTIPTPSSPALTQRFFPKQIPPTTIPRSSLSPQTAAEKSPPKVVIKSIFGGPISKPKPPPAPSTYPTKALRERLQNRKTFQQTTLFKSSRKFSTPLPASLLRNSSSKLKSRPHAPSTPIAEPPVAMMEAKAGVSKGMGSEKKREEVFIDLTETDGEEEEEEDE